MKSVSMYGLFSKLANCLKQLRKGYKKYISYLHKILFGMFLSLMIYIWYCLIIIGYHQDCIQRGEG